MTTPTSTSKNERALRTELQISWALRIGVTTCGILITLGLVSRLIGLGEHEAQSSQHLVSEVLRGHLIPEFHPISAPGELIQGVLHWQPDLIITAGLLLLIGLPILRVAMTVFIFLHERDWPFVTITLIVLTVLLSGIFLGHAL